MDFEQLEVGKLYRYQGTWFKHQTVRYAGKHGGLYGMTWLFEPVTEGYTVYNGLTLSHEGLKDLVEV